MIDQQYIDGFSEMGFFVVRNGFSRNRIVDMRQRLDGIIHGLHTKKGRRFQTDTDSGNYEDIDQVVLGYQGPNAVYRKIADLEYDALFLECLQSLWIKELCAHFCGDPVSIMRVTMMNKPAGAGTPLPWHQDISMDWPTAAQPEFALWFPLDRAIEKSGSLQVIPGSHRHGIIGRGHFLGNKLEERYAPASKIFTVELEPGDCLFFHPGLLHRSGVNVSDTPRRAINCILIQGVAMHTRKNTPYPILQGAGCLKPEGVEFLTEIPGAAPSSYSN